MYVVSSVTTSCLAETNLIAKLFPFFCQVSTKFKQFCSPIIANFKEFYNENLETGTNFASFNQSTQHTVKT